MRDWRLGPNTLPQANADARRPTMAQLGATHLCGLLREAAARSAPRCGALSPEALQWGCVLTVCDEKTVRVDRVRGHVQLPSHLHFGRLRSIHTTWATHGPHMGHLFPPCHTDRGVCLMHLTSFGLWGRPGVRRLQQPGSARVRLSGVEGQMQGDARINRGRKKQCKACCAIKARGSRNEGRSCRAHGGRQQVDIQGRMSSNLEEQ